MKFPNKNNDNSIISSIKGLIKKLGWKLSLLIGSSIGIPVIFIFIAPLILILIIMTLVFSFSLMFSIPTEDVTGKLDTELGKVDTNDHYAIEGYLESNKCELSISENASWLFSDLFGVDFIPSSECGTKALINKIIKTKLNEMKTYGTKTEEDLTPGLLLSTIMYGYTTNVNSSTEEITDPIKMLTDLLKSETITSSELKELIDNMVSKTLYPVYTWNEDIKETKEKIKNKDGTFSEKLVKITHTMSCKQTDVKNMQFDYQKYFTYLRYGKEVVGYINGNNASNIAGSGYEYQVNLNASWGSTDDKCRTGIYEITEGTTQGDVTVEYVYDSASIEKSKNFFSSRGINENSSILKDEEFLKIADPSTTKKDDTTITIDQNKYNYSNGAMYNIFPKFKKNTEYKWDDIYSPKTIESIIHTIDSHENDMNSVLGYNNIYNTNTSPIIPIISLNGSVFPLEKSYILTSCQIPRVHPVTGKGQTAHNGIDIGVPKNTRILSFLPGKVVEVKNDMNTQHGRGHYITIMHEIKEPSGNISYLFTRYQHLGSQNSTDTGQAVKTGQIVAAGDLIGYSGSSGASTGPHLHFEALINNKNSTLSESKYVDSFKLLTDPFNTTGKELKCKYGFIIGEKNYE